MQFHKHFKISRTIHVLQTETFIMYANDCVPGKIQNGGCLTHFVLKHINPIKMEF